MVLHLLFIYYLFFKDNKKQYIASITFCYLVGCIYQLGLHTVNGMIDFSIVKPFLICLPSLLIGYLLGERLLMKIEVEKIKKYVYMIILIMGTVIIFSEVQ